MPIHIDNFDTTIELTEPAASPPATRADAAPATGGAVSGDAMGDALMKILSDQLERYARMRGH